MASSSSHRIGENFYRNLDTEDHLLEPAPHSQRRPKAEVSGAQEAGPPNYTISRDEIGDSKNLLAAIMEKHGESSAPNASAAEAAKALNRGDNATSLSHRAMPKAITPLPIAYFADYGDPQAAGHREISFGPGRSMQQAPQPQTKPRHPVQQEESSATERDLNDDASAREAWHASTSSLERFGASPEQPRGILPRSYSFQPGPSTGASLREAPSPITYLYHQRDIGRLGPYNIPPFSPIPEDNQSYLPERQYGIPRQMQSPGAYVPYAATLQARSPYSHNSVPFHHEARDQGGQRDDGDLANGLQSGLSGGDASTMQEMALRIQQLERELRRSQQEPESALPKVSDPEAVNIQILHCVDDGKDQPQRLFTSKPEWNINQRRAWLSSPNSVEDLRTFIQERNISIIVCKHYCQETWSGKVQSALQNLDPFPIPKPEREEVSLVTEEIIDVLDAFCRKNSHAKCKLSKWRGRPSIQEPIVWWFHCRKAFSLEPFSDRQSSLLKVLTDWMEEHYAKLYEQIGDQFSRGKVTAASLKYLIKEGDVLVATQDDLPVGCIATEAPWVSTAPAANTEDQSQEQSIIYKIGTRTFAYAGDLHWEQSTHELIFQTENDEVDISSLSVVPLEHVQTSVKDLLSQRGETFWKCRTRRMVSSNNESGGSQNMQRYMVDFEMYEELHPDGAYSLKRKEKKPAMVLSKDQPIPQAPEIYLFPPLISGFHLRGKRWVKLQVDRIQDVTWNEGAFDSLVLDAETKELILALVTNQLEYPESGTDLIANKGNGLIMLLHGAPGTGKTFTAESVAEIAKKPLYAVTCGDIGTQPEEVEKYLESVLYIGKVWGCIVLLDEADVFLEQRSHSDLERNALVSIFIRVLEYYDGILILTTNRVGAFDEAFKSRIQLALHYPRLGRYQRTQIWRNFFNRLELISGEESIDIDDLNAHIDEFAACEMNGRQIRNSIMTARQLAKFQKTKMSSALLNRALTVAQKFDDYLYKVRGGMMEEDWERTGDGRYSDEYFARRDGTR